MPAALEKPVDYHTTQMLYLDLAHHALEAESKHLANAQVKLKLAKIVPELFRANLLVEFVRIMRSANLCARISREASFKAHNPSGSKLRNWVQQQYTYLQIYIS